MKFRWISKKQVELFGVIALVLVFTILFLTGIKTFRVSEQMQQVFQNSQWAFDLPTESDDLSKQPENSESANRYGGREIVPELRDVFWAPRKISLAPAPIGHHLTGAPINLAFSIYVLFLLTIVAFVNSQLVQREFADTNIRLTHAFLTLYLLLAWFMNGRLAFSFLATSLVLYYFQNYREAKFIHSLCLLVALMAASVSSGVFAVIFSSVILLMICRLLLYPRYFLTPPGIASSLIVIASSVWFALALYKAFAYYNTSLSGVLSHGLGAIVGSETRVAMSLILVIAALFVTHSWFTNPRANFAGLRGSARILIAVSLVGSLAGLSALSVTLTSVLSMVMTYLLERSRTAIT